MFAPNTCVSPSAVICARLCMFGLFALFKVRMFLAFQHRRATLECVVVAPEDRMVGGQLIVGANDVLFVVVLNGTLYRISPQGSVDAGRKPEVAIFSAAG